MDLQGMDCLYLPQSELGVPDLPVEITRLLIVGTAPPDAFALAAEVRLSPAPPSGLDVGGFFAFRSQASWHGIYVQSGPHENPTTLASRALEDSHWCMATRRWAQFLWDTAKPLLEPSRFNAGDQVPLVGSEQVGTVKSVERVAGRSVYQVWLGAGQRVLDSRRACPRRRFGLRLGAIPG